MLGVVPGLPCGEARPGVKSGLVAADVVATWSMGCFGDDGPFETGDAPEWTAREHACWRAGR